MLKTPKWLKYKDIGYIIDDNYTGGTYYQYVIYPNRQDDEGYFCLYNTAMTKKETMVDILPFWEDEIESEQYGYDKIEFEKLYNARYTEIDNIFYKNLSFYSDIILFEEEVNYEPYKVWFCKNKKSFEKLWNIIKKKKLTEIQEQFKLKQT